MATRPVEPVAVSRTVVRRVRHPFVGLIGGLLLGCGVAILLITYAIVPLGVATPYVVIALFVVLGLLWGLFAPTRGRRPPEPVG
jgi:VIT1/CCC1 family predicted Fe2+/Mn2+ transporter